MDSEVILLKSCDGYNVRNQHFSIARIIYRNVNRVDINVIVGRFGVSFRGETSRARLDLFGHAFANSV